MMANLFIIFDPMTNMFMSLNWICMLFGIFFLPLNYWIFYNQMNFLFSLIINFLNKEFENLLESFNKGYTFMFISLLVFIFYNNFMGLFPYIFTCSSHLIMNLSLSFTFWLTFMIYGWLFKSIYMFSHMIPFGTPVLLMSFMVIIECISNLIRSFTLAVRLMANMIAGHLLLTLLGNMGEILNFLILLLIFIQFLLLLLEFMVAIIQSYVFSVLLILYFKEVN